MNILSKLTHRLIHRPNPRLSVAPRPSSELIELNKNTLSYVQSLTLDEIQNRLDEVSSEVPKTEADINRIGEILKREGIIIIPEFLSKQVAQKVDDEVQNLVRLVKSTDADGSGFENEEFIIQGTKPIVSGYNELATHAKTIITIRQGMDQGMLDIFNADRILGKTTDEVFSAFNSPWVKKLIASYSNQLKPSNLNVYVNEGLAQTRGMHVDDFNSTIKGFVYLTDVSSIAEGPYCYVRGTHVESSWRHVNKAISQVYGSPTESPFVPLEKILPVLGKKGTLVISNQSGIHRGIPQCPDAIRRLLVMRYR